MEEERSIDRLARHLINLGAFAIIAALCWYFRSVIAYIIVAFVISLLGQPIFKALKGFTNIVDHTAATVRYQAVGFDQYGKEYHHQAG